MTAELALACGLTFRVDGGCTFDCKRCDAPCIGTAKTPPYDMLCPTCFKEDTDARL